MSPAYVSYFTLRPFGFSSVGQKRDRDARTHTPAFLAGSRTVHPGLDKKRRGYDRRCRLSALLPNLLFRARATGLTHLTPYCARQLVERLRSRSACLGLGRQRDRPGTWDRCSETRELGPYPWGREARCTGFVFVTRSQKIMRSACDLRHVSVTCSSAYWDGPHTLTEVRPCKWQRSQSRR
jgi:hypothetical protein